MGKDNNKPASAVFVVAHGLNMKPEAMEPLMNELRANGAEVFLVKLSGHSGASFSGLRRNSWQQDMAKCYQLAHRRAVELEAPLYFLGYSLGALIAQATMTGSQGRMSFDKQILIAPATAIRPRAHLLRPAFLLPGHWLIPSRAPVGYRIASAVPILAYKILFEQQARVLRSEFKYLNIPTLIFIDARDELISLHELKKHITRFKLGQYKIIELDSREVEKKTRYHHLIIDERSMGPNNWKKVTASIASFFFTGC